MAYAFTVSKCKRIAIAETLDDKLGRSNPPRAGDCTSTPRQLLNCTLFVSHAAHGGGGHVLYVLVQRPSGGLQGRWDPCGSAGSELAVCEVHCHDLLIRINYDLVTVLQKTDGATNLIRKGLPSDLSYINVFGLSQMSE